MLFKNQKVSFFFCFSISSPTLPFSPHGAEPCGPWRRHSPHHHPTLLLCTSLTCFCRLLSLRPLVWSSTYLENVFPNPDLSRTLVWFPPHLPFCPALRFTSILSPPSWNLRISLGLLTFSLLASVSFCKNTVSSSQPTSIPGWLPRLVSGSYWRVSLGKMAESSLQTLSSDTGWTVNLFLKARTILSFLVWEYLQYMNLQYQVYTKNVYISIKDVMEP